MTALALSRTAAGPRRVPAAHRRAGGSARLNDEGDRVINPDSILVYTTAVLCRTNKSAINDCSVKVTGLAQKSQVGPRF